MKKIVVFSVLTVLLTLSIYSRVTNKDKPLNGKWDFKKTKIWEVEGSESQVFANIGGILSDDRETVFVTDRKNFKTFIFDKNGKFVAAFGNKGEGPGELRQMPRPFLVNDLLVFPDRRAHKVLFFSKKGEFLKSVAIPDNLRPRLMIDEHRILSVPYINYLDPKGKAEGLIYNLKDKSKQRVFNFSSYRKGMVRKSSGNNTSTFTYSDSSITPMMVVGYQNNRIYYGMNDRYFITVKDLDLNVVLDFSLDREKTAVPAGFKRELAKEIDFPEEIKKEIIKGFPEHFTYFERIFADQRQNIYVLVTDPLKHNRMKLDFFSPSGSYIYEAEILVEENLELLNGIFKKDKLYLAVETEDGDIRLIKYNVNMPSAARGLF